MKNEVELTLKVKLRSYTDETMTPEELIELGAILSRDEWSDGRFPFGVELTQEGLNQMLARARAQLIWEQAVRLGNEQVETRRRYCEDREGRGLPALTVGCDFTFTLSPTEERR